MITLAFLQNQWGTAASKRNQIPDMPIDVYTEYVQLCLFAGCLTGRKLEAAFGEHVVQREIIWANVSKQAGKLSSDKFPADYNHMVSLMEHYKPDVVISFGNIANEACEGLVSTCYQAKLIKCVHPAARFNTKQALQQCAEEWRHFKEWCGRQG